MKNEEPENGAIAELGNSTEVSQTSSSKTISDHKKIVTDIPHMTWVYTDHDKKCDIVCVAIAAISGSTDISFGISEDGMTVFVYYTWPTPLFSPKELFKKKLVGNVTMDHPEIYSFASRLTELEWSEKSKPKGVITVSLPVKVQREVDTWTREGIKCDNTNIILLKFKAFQKKLAIEDADTSITFS